MTVSKAPRVAARRQGLATLLMCVLALSACASLPERGNIPSQNALAPGIDTSLDLDIVPMENNQPGKSGFILLEEGRKAFAARAHITREAQRSLDIQTYIWHGDFTGRYLVYEVLAAADRGVRVRLLLDDLDTLSRQNILLALDSHPNIEVRLFNPLASRRGPLVAMANFFSSFHRLNHRMHIKNWVADNRVAIAGGRNVGDEYFTASDETNFADLEFMMVGPVVRDASTAFDRFWDAGQVYPVTMLEKGRGEVPPLEQVREDLKQIAAEASQSKYAVDLRKDSAVKRLAAGEEDVYWLDSYQLVADAPDKIDRKGILEKSAVMALLLPVMQSAEKELIILSPYFVPGKEGTAVLVNLAQKGVRVQMLTNSLAANDVAAVHGGYSRYRETLVKAGVQIWELKPQAGGPADFSLLGSSGASLHAKALSVDGHWLFVGSYNLDPRSTALNAEMGVLVDSVPLAQRFQAILSAHEGTNSAWRLSWADDRLHWSDGHETLTREPSASLWRRFQAWAARVLRVDPLL